MAEIVEKQIENAILGCLVGTAVGDSLGLPFEAMCPGRISRLNKSLDKHHFFFGSGMISDDTEHSILLTEALVASNGNEQDFIKHFSKSLKLWLLALPSGIGLATLKATVKLLFGVSPNKSGVFSAGNGPAMRSAIIGVCYGNNMARMKSLVSLSTRLTHTDPKAELGALAVSQAAYMASTNSYVSPLKYLEQLDLLTKGYPGKEEFIASIREVIGSVDSNKSIEEFVRDLNLTKGVTGYIYHTAPVVLFLWLKYQNSFDTAIKSVIRCGGDTDTTAAILGAIIGAGAGPQGIPEHLLNNICDWPYSLTYIRERAVQLSRVLSNNKSINIKTPTFVSHLIRNLLFMLIVIPHGIRRLLPPY